MGMTRAKRLRLKGEQRKRSRVRSGWGNACANPDHGYERNHEPHQQGQWFDYTGFRYKDYYDIRLLNGRVIKYCRPNAHSWSAWKTGEGCFADFEVEAIRLKPDCELDDLCQTGKARIDRQLVLFGHPTAQTLREARA